MRFFHLILVVLISFNGFGQTHALSGTWQGVIVQAGHPEKNGTLLYCDFSINGNSVEGRTREELYVTEHYAVKKITGTLEENGISFRQIVVEKSTKNGRQKWCRFEAELSYDSITGYLEGSFESTDCKRVIGKIILYRSEFTLPVEEDPEYSHLWFEQFLRDRKEGLNAPEIRRIERANFVFEPVFFDFDKHEIRPEHVEFLKRLIKVVKGHSDLRVKVIGHTDAHGTNAYNDTLSRKRAEAIIAFFVRYGLSADRLEFDFKGETQPVDSNTTPDGRQRNRRVDFSFI